MIRWVRDFKRRRVVRIETVPKPKLNSKLELKEMKQNFE